MHRRYDFGERKVTWTELFFDLVFVAAAHKIAYTLQETSLLTSTPYIFAFILLLWVWMGHTLFTTRFEGRSLIYHLLTFVSMAGVLALVVQIDGMFAEYMMPFALTYAGLRLVLLLLYIWALSRNMKNAVYLVPLLAGILASTVIWAISPFVPITLAFWVVGFLIDFFTPIVGRKLLKKVMVHTTHLPERLGLLTVIMLGEMIISMVIAVHDLDSKTVAILVMGLLTVGTIFWLYFRYIEKVFMSSYESSGQLYLYAHFPMFVGLLLLASGFKGILAHHDARWLVISGMVLFIISFRAIKYVQEKRIQRRQLLLFALFLPLLIIYYAVGGKHVILTAVLSGAFIAYMVASDFIMPLLKPSRRDQYFEMKGEL